MSREVRSKTVRSGLLRGRMRNPLEWSYASKSAMGTFVVGLFSTVYAFQGEHLLANPGAAPYVNRAALASGTSLCWLASLVWYALAGLSLLLRRYSPQNRAWVYFIIQFYSLTSVVLAYYLGLMTSPIGLTLFGGLVLSFMFFEIAPVLSGFVTFFFLYSTATVLEQMGVIPYAPFFDDRPVKGGRLAVWWLMTSGTSTLVATSIVVFAMAYTISQWRDREARLAEAYEDLSRARDELVRAESLAAVGSLVTGAAHELHNPLGSSSALLQSVQEDVEKLAGPSEEDRQNLLDTLRLAGNGQARAVSIVERLYGLTEALNTHGPLVKLSDMAGELKEIYPSLRVTFSGVDAGARVRNAVGRTILPNLIDNAIAAGGTESPSLSFETLNGMAIFNVGDSGSGIEEAQLPHVFKPFFTGNKTGTNHSVGLGLYIVHEVAARLGGSVEIDSRVGKGTNVKVRIPLESTA